MKFIGLKGITRTTIIIVAVVIVIAAGVAGYYGLSALTRQPHFNFRNLRVSPSVVKPGDEITISLDIHNSGNSRGTIEIDEQILEIYTNANANPIGVIAELTLEAGETKTVTYTFTVPEDISANEITVDVFESTVWVQVVSD